MTGQDDDLNEMEGLRVFTKKKQICELKMTNIFQKKKTEILNQNIFDGTSVCEIL